MSRADQARQRIQRAGGAISGDSAKRQVEGGHGHIALGGEHGQELLNLCGTQLPRVAHLAVAPMPADKEFHPIHVRLFGSQAIVFVPQHLPQLIQQAGRLGDIGDGFGGHHKDCNCIQYRRPGSSTQAVLRHFPLL